MSTVITPALGDQRESDVQRRVDLAVQFGIWACGRKAFPKPGEIQRQFGVSRRTAGRWRKSLARAIAAGSSPKPPRIVKPATQAEIVASLLAEPALLDVPVPVLATDVRKRFSVGPTLAKRAINDAIRAADGDSRGTGEGT